jgi:hypothetical protein
MFARLPPLAVASTSQPAAPQCVLNKFHLMKQVIVLAFTLPLALIACTTPMNTPDVKHNPNPKMRYEITLTIKDAPGPFESITGYMLYKVVNEQCAPFEKFIGIYRTPPGQNVPFALTRVNDHEYNGIIYLDLLQDEDYYGKGACRWSMPFVLTNLKGGGVTFAPDVSQEQIIQQQSVTLYFPKKAFGNPALQGSSDGGTTISDIVASYRDEFFSITLSTKEKFK